MPFVTVAAHRIEYERIEVARASRPTLVFLHEGLGSVAMWRDFPGRVAHATSCNALVYSRYGYGRSDPLAEPRTVRIHARRGAGRAAGAARPARRSSVPILVGHSDGGSIALIHAGSGVRPVAGVVTLAAHVFVEDISDREHRRGEDRLRDDGPAHAKLARHHADVDSAFLGWNRIWLDPAFRAWNIEEFLPRIACPVLAIQGEDDEYGTMEQMRRIGAARAPTSSCCDSQDCRHSAHRDQPDAVIEAIIRFVDRVTARA